MLTTAVYQHSTQDQTCCCDLDLRRDPGAPFAASAARYRALAAEAEIQALIAIRTNADAIQRTEAAFRGLIVKQARCLRHARLLERRMNAEVSQ